MKKRIGKYRIDENTESLKIFYIYTFSDVIGGLMYLLGLFIGLSTLYVVFVNLDKEIFTFDFWFLLIIGTFLTIWFSIFVIGSLVNPLKSILEISKANQEITIRNLFKTEKIKISTLRSIYCELIYNYKPKRKYGMFMIGLVNGEKKECFVIRSAIPIDLGRKIDKEIYDTANEIKNVIYNFIELNI